MHVFSYEKTYKTIEVQAERWFSYFNNVQFVSSLLLLLKIFRLDGSLGHFASLLPKICATESRKGNKIAESNCKKGWHFILILTSFIITFLLYCIIF